MQSENNTFSDYQFEDWVPKKTQQSIREFWGNYQPWLDDPKVQGLSELSHHGPNPNGFQMPPNGATCEFFIKDWDGSKKVGYVVYIIVKGRYIHRWNNIGSIIDKDGNDIVVSTCDRWVRIFTSEEEKKSVINQ